MRSKTIVAALMIAVITTVAPTAFGGSSIEPVDGSAQLVGVRGVAVPPVKRTEVQSLVDLGTVDTEGFTTIVLNLAGQMQSVDETGGDVGVILIPDVAPFDTAFTGHGLLPASLELTARVSSRESPYFMANQKRFEVGFPRYRALLYNNTRSSVTVSVFAYRAR